MVHGCSSSPLLLLLLLVPKAFASAESHFLGGAGQSASGKKERARLNLLVFSKLPCS